MKMNILALVFLKIHFPAELMLKINNMSRPNLPHPTFQCELRLFAEN